MLCSSENDIAGDFRVEMSYQDGGHPARPENPKPEVATGDLIYDSRKSRLPSERPTMAQIVQVFAALSSSFKTPPLFTVVPSPIPTTTPSFAVPFQSLSTALDEVH